MKVILFVVASLFLLSFDEPDFVKPKKVKKIIEMQKDSQSNYFKSSERIYDKEGRMIEKIFFNSLGDTVKRWKFQYRNGKPIAWMSFSQDKSDSAQIFSTNDTVQVVRRAFHTFYIFDANGDVVRYWNNKMLYSPPSYKVIKTKNELNSIEYTTVDRVYYSMKYQYKKEASNTRREKVFVPSFPTAEDGGKKNKIIEEVLLTNAKKEILQRTVYLDSPKKDSVLYSYKYEYHK